MGRTINAWIAATFAAAVAWSAAASLPSFADAESEEQHSALPEAGAAVAELADLPEPHHAPVPGAAAAGLAILCATAAGGFGRRRRRR